MNINIKQMNIDALIKVGVALNNSYRRKILTFCQDKDHTISEIKKKIDLTYANTYKHVKVLSDAGLVYTKEDKNLKGKIVLVKSLYKITKEKNLEKIN